jgi:trimeric autotransporter adhesin
MRASFIRCMFVLTLFFTLVGAGSSWAQYRQAVVPAAQGDEYWDPRFGTPGISGRVVYALAADGGDNLYIGGAIEGVPGVPAQGIARWDGERWHALGTGIAYPQTVLDIAIQGAHVYVVGAFSNAGGVPANGVARWDGNAWSRLGSGVGPRIKESWGLEPGSIRAAAVAPNGDLYVGGEFNVIDNVAANGVARWNGSAWSAVGGGVYNGEPDDASFFTVNDLAFGADGILYAGGQFGIAAGQEVSNIAAWNGTAWSSLAGGLKGGWESRVNALLFHAGQLYAAGSFSEAGEAPVHNIAAWNGTAWAALGDGLAESPNEAETVLTLLGDGETLLAGGRFRSAGGQPIGGLARWNGTSWAAVAPAGEGIANDLLTEVRALAPAPEGGFAAGGNLVMENEHAFHGVARWDGERWMSLGKGVAQAGDFPADVDTIAIDGAGRVFIGGLINYVGGAPVRNIAMWDGARWHNIGDITGDEPNVYALLVLGDDLYVGGRFNQAGGISARGIARYHIPSGSWSALGSGVDGNVRALAYGDGKLFVGGDFDVAGGVEALEVAIWDGTAWAALGGQFEIYEVLDSGNRAGTYVNALAYVHGELFIGGRFQTIRRSNTPRNGNGSYTAVHNIVSYNLANQQWLLVGPDIHPGVTLNGFSNMFTAVRSLAYVGGDLYVGGDFNQAGGIPANNFASYDLLTNLWAAPGSIAGPGGRLTVRAVTSYGPDVFVGGTFTSIGNTPARFVGRYNSVTGQWSTLGAGMRWYNDEYTHVNTIAVGEGGLYLGGGFDYAGPHPSLGFARWNGPLDPTVPPDPLENGGGGGGEPGQTYQVVLPMVKK